jgi:hypothetical protein
MAGKRTASTIAKLCEVLYDYDHLCPLGMERFDCECAAPMLKYAASEYLTASKNHVALNIPKRVEKSFMRSFRALKQKFTATNRYKIWQIFWGR